LSKSRKNIRFQFLFILCFLSIISVAQNLNDTLHLAPFEVKSNFLSHNPGFKKVRIDSSILLPQANVDLATVLAQHSTLFIKSYGSGSLATSSLRGTSSSHTQVEWNGISINSPMLGMADLSQIPVSQVSQVEILYGPADIVLTNGAFGGVINLITMPDWSNRTNFAFSQTLASFSSYATNAGIAIGNQNVQSITKMNYGSAINDFPYFDDQTNSIKKQRNAQYSSAGISQEAFFKLSKKYFLTTRLWYSQNDTRIPPSSPIDHSSQKDHALRSLIELKRAGKKNVLIFRSAIVDQYMKYTNAQGEIDTVSNHQVYSWTNRLKWNYSGIKWLSIKPGIDINHDWVISDAYSDKKTRSTVGAFSEFLFSVNKKLDFTLVGRQDLIDGDILPFIVGFGGSFMPFSKIDLSFNANLSRNYRHPSLNDLYWSPWGDSTLLPEMDLASEINVIYKFLNNRHNFFFEAELSGYFSKMTDLIQWTPEAGNSSVWRPKNVREVHARGIEAGLNLMWHVWKGKITLDNNYSYCRSTNEKAMSPTDASVGKQLIYIPVHSFNSTLSLTRNEFYLNYNFQYVSKRFTGTDNQTYMPGYYLSNIILGKNIHLQKIILSLQVQINNLFDLDYQSIASRPMPGRNFAVTLKFNFANKQKEE
jgi:outer membrane cobalamin receptor